MMSPSEFIMKLKSSLEDYAFDRLTEEGVEFAYEPSSVVLLPSFEHLFKSYERKKKVFKPITNKVRSITYKPDFVGRGWIMETKGRRTPEFDLRWKLFKYLLREQDWNIFMPRTKKEIDEAISIIKDGKNNELLQLPKSVKQLSKDARKPKVDKTKERKPRNRGRR